MLLFIPEVLLHTHFTILNILNTRIILQCMLITLNKQQLLQSMELSKHFPLQPRSILLRTEL